jgi:hypothetical protein
MVRIGSLLLMVMLLAGVSAREAAAATICGPHAYIAWTRPLPGGGTHYECKCRPGFVEIAPGTVVRGKPPHWPGCRAKSKEQPKAYDCGVCRDKLIADVRKAWASQRTRYYVGQALSGYENCKLKARGACFLSDIQARTIRRGCDQFADEEAYRACIGRLLPP